MPKSRVPECDMGSGMSSSATQSSQSVSQIISALDSVCTLPEVTARIAATINDANSSASDLTDILSHDPSLVSRLLKLVNSALYGRSTPIASVERAVVLLGFDVVHHLALAASMGKLFRGIRLCAEFGPKDLWTHCIAVGVVAPRYCPPG